MNPTNERNVFQRSWATLNFSFNHVFRARRGKFRENVLPTQPGFWLAFASISATILLLMVFVDADLVAWKRSSIESGSMLHSVFEVVTRFGTSGWILVISGTMGVVLSATSWRQLSRRKMSRRIGLYADANFIFFTVALSGIAANLIKNTIGRARPKWLSELGPHHFDFGAFQSSFASFPSGHSTTFGALCMAMALLLPGWRLIWLILAVLGGVSRVVVGAHYPSDVVAGLTFGSLFVILSARWLAQRRVMFQFGENWLPLRMS